MATIPIFFGATTWVQKPWVRNLRIAPLNTYIDPRDAWIGAHRSRWMRGRLRGAPIA